jgi:mannonate dehydratase
MEDIGTNSNGFTLSGWEPYRLKELKELFGMYKNIDEEKLFSNYQYFLEEIIPVCEEINMKMAIHPDDTPWSIFGLPRIVTSQKNLEPIIKLVDSPCNGLTLCSGSLGANPENDIPEMIRSFGDRGKIHFAHVRNIKFVSERTFHETAHLSSYGSFDMFEIMKALYDIKFNGASCERSEQTLVNVPLGGDESHSHL